MPAVVIADHLVVDRIGEQYEIAQLAAAVAPHPLLNPSPESPTGRGCVANAATDGIQTARSAMSGCYPDCGPMRGDLSHVAGESFEESVELAIADRARAIMS